MFECQFTLKTFAIDLIAFDRFEELTALKISENHFSKHVNMHDFNESVKLRSLITLCIPNNIERKKRV